MAKAYYGDTILEYLEADVLESDIELKLGEEVYTFDFFDRPHQTLYKVFDSVDVEEMIRFSVLTQNPQVPEIKFLLYGDSMGCNACASCNGGAGLCVDLEEIGVRLGAYILLDGSVLECGPDEEYYEMESHYKHEEDEDELC